MNGPQADFPPVPFPAPIDTEPFKAAWKDWQDYAKARRLRKWVPQTVTAKLAELAALGEAAAIAAIQRSISSGWQSIHPDTRPGHAQASTQPLFR
jgi:hypothetical protein